MGREGGNKSALNYLSLMFPLLCSVSKGFGFEVLIAFVAAVIMCDQIILPPGIPRERSSSSSGHASFRGCCDSSVPCCGKRSRRDASVDKRCCLWNGNLSPLVSQAADETRAEITRRFIVWVQEELGSSLRFTTFIQSFMGTRVFT